MKKAYALLVVLLSLFLVFAGETDAGKKKKKSAPTIPRADEVPKYLEMLKSPSPAARATAAERLGLRGTVNYLDVEPAIDPLKKLLRKDADASVRRAAATALGNIHPEAKDTVPLLVETIKTDKAMDVKLAAVVAVGQFGKDARQALPALRELAGKFENKKSMEFQTVQAAIKNVAGGKKKQ